MLSINTCRPVMRRIRDLPRPAKLLSWGRAAEGGTYAAARKAAEADPLCASSWHVLGLAAEARGSRKEAVAALQKAAALLNDDAGAVTDALEMQACRAS